MDNNNPQISNANGGMGPGNIGPDPNNMMGQPQPINQMGQPMQAQPMGPGPMGQPMGPAQMGQPMQAQPMNPGPMGQPMQAQPMGPSPVGGGGSDSKKKMWLIGGIVGAVVLVVVIVLVVVLLGNGQKTVSCKTNTSVMSINVDIDTNVRVGNGKIIDGDEKVVVDLASLSDLYRENESEIVDGIVEQYRYNCNSGCSFDYNHKAGNRLEMNLKYDSDGVQDNLVYSYGSMDGMSAQEIADKVQKAMEGSDTTCKQS